jgi:hypothetical protein
MIVAIGDRMAASSLLWACRGLGPRRMPQDIPGIQGHVPWQVPICLGFLGFQPQKTQTNHEP